MCNGELKYVVCFVYCVTWLGMKHLVIAINEKQAVSAEIQSRKNSEAMFLLLDREP